MNKMKMPGFNAELSLLSLPISLSQKLPISLSPKLPISLSPKLPIYGNYCGPGYGDPTGKTPPIDDVDACCRIHDMCYDKRGYSDCSCDRELIDCLKSKRIWLTPKGRAAFAISAYFKSAPCISHSKNGSGSSGGSRPGKIRRRML
jgi:hypothetical protein